MSGSAADQATSQDMAVSEAMKAIILIIPVTILILILVTESWIEPLFYLLNIGTPVLINLCNDGEQQDPRCLSGQLHCESILFGRLRPHYSLFGLCL